MYGKGVSSRVLQWLRTCGKPKAENANMGSGTAKTDLTFISSKELIDELAKRHDALVVLGMRFNKLNQYSITRFHAGHRYVCLGMMSNMQSLINDTENEQLKYNKEDNA